MKLALPMALLLSALPAPAQPVVSQDPTGAAQVTLSNGKKRLVPKEPGQTGIREIHTAPNGTIGWLVEYKIETTPEAPAGMLVLWHAGKLLHRYPTEQSFYSWAFYAEGKQVAFHTGPLHGETKSHCELREAATGRLLATWEGDLDSSAARPAWTKTLTH